MRRLSHSLQAVLLLLLLSPWSLTSAQADGTPVWRDTHGHHTASDPLAACQATTARFNASRYGYHPVNFVYVIYRSSGIGSLVSCYATFTNIARPITNILDYAECIAYCPTTIPPQCLKNAPCIPSTPVQKNTGGPAATNPCDGASPLDNGSDPVNAATGNEYLRETDYQAANASLTFRRSYNSALGVTPTPQTTPVGIGWHHSFDQSVFAVSATAATITRADGKAYGYTLVNGVWTTDADIVDTLAQLTRWGKPDGWRYTTADHTVELYNASGKLLSITRADGYGQSLTYSDGTAAHGGYMLSASGMPTVAALPAGLLIRVTDSNGRSLQFGYNNNHQIVRMTDPSGATYSYGYDANLNLTSVTWPDGHVRSYRYDNTNFPHALTGLIDENGNRYATWVYDSTGRVSSSEHANGVGKYRFAYTNGSTGNPVSTVVTDPRNTARTYTFTNILGVARNAAVSQACDTCPGNIALSLRYDAHGNVISRTGFDGRVTSYVFDKTRNLEIRHTEAAGTPQARTILTNWSPDFRLPVLINQPGRVIRYRYDRFGNVLSQTISDSRSGASQTRLSYTTAADHTLPNLLKTLSISSNNATQITTYGYYPNGDLHTASTAQGQVITATNYDANGRPLSFTGPGGLVTSLSYTPRGWLQSKTVSSETTRYSYDAVGQRTQASYPGGQVIRYAYDAAHRLTDITDGLGNHIHYSLDALGKRTDMVYHDASGAVVSGKNSAFDALFKHAYVNGNLISRVSPLVLNAYLFDSSSGSGRFSSALTPFDVFVPGTSANQAFVNATTHGINAISAMCNSTHREECEKSCDAEYDRGRNFCRAMSGMRGRDKKTFQACMAQVDAQYVACYQNCGE